MEALPERFVWSCGVLLVLTCAGGETPADEPDNVLANATPDTNEQASVEREHPYGETPLGRMIVLAHTDNLPDCDRLTVAAIRLPSVKKQSQPVVLATRKLDAAKATTICDLWRGLTFDKWKSAFCHIPVYRLRFFKQGKLHFETSICWKCSNVLLPDIECVESDDGVEGEGRVTLSTQTYGFESDAASVRLLEGLQALLPHPDLSDDEPVEASR